jgi:hypothetical protein
VVPGNHDISRPVASSGDIFDKFNEIKQAWVDINREEMQPSVVRTTHIQDANSKATIFSVNSCVGCGEQRYLPESVRDEMQKVLDDYSAKNGVDKAFDLIGEQLDTPAIHDDHIGTIMDSIRQLQKQSEMPIILAHHGLLPQATTRMQIYSELLNSGSVRFSLASHGRPVIYCHGHIHEDPIEIVTHPQQENGRVVMISAPLLKDGFNLINLIFNTEGSSLGCEIFPFRLQNGQIVKKEAIRISLLDGENIIPSGSKLSKALSKTSDVFKRFDEIKNAVDLDDADTADALLELEWMSHLEIRNRKDEHRHWQIRRTLP